MCWLIKIVQCTINHYKLFVVAWAICRGVFLMVVTINSSVLLERGELHDNNTDNEGGLAAQKVWLQEDHVQIQTTPSSDDNTNQNTSDKLYCLDLEMTFGFSLFV